MGFDESLTSAMSMCKGQTTLSMLQYIVWRFLFPNTAVFEFVSNSVYLALMFTEFSTQTQLGFK